MPHVSKRKLDRGVAENIERRLETLLVETSDRNRGQIFSEVITRTEHIMFAKRLGCLFLLQQGKSINAVSRTLKISPSTVNRYAIKLETGSFRNTSRWLKVMESRKSFRGFIVSLLEIPFEAQHKSLNQLLNKY